MFDVIPVPAFEDNYIWLLSQSGGKSVVIIDPGEAEPVLVAIENLELEPVAILLTHHHGDHVGGVESLLARHPMPVYGPATESIRSVSHPLSDGDTLCLKELNLTLEIILPK